MIEEGFMTRRETFLLKDQYRIKGCLLEAFASVLKEKSRAAYTRLRHFCIVARSRHYIDADQFQVIMSKAKGGIK
jgi:hypothetical protein